MASTFSAGGLASGMDTQSIIDQLVKLESRPLDVLAKRRTAFQSQVSSLGAIASRLSTLGTAADALGAGGVLAAKVTSSNTAFTAVPGTGATAGSYQVTVEELARASKWRSAAFGTADRVAGGKLTLEVQGTTLPDITVTEGSTLGQVAEAIRASGAAVSVAVLNDGTSSYLSITARNSGHPPSGPSDALAVTFTPDAGATGKVPGFSEIQSAANAVVDVDGVRFTRSSNAISDVIPGTTLTLVRKGGAAEDLVVETDGSATKANLQKFVDAYNDVMKLVQRELAVTAQTDREKTLVGDATVRSLQSRLQTLVTNVVSGLGGVRTLADVGVKTARDGSLSIDQTTFDRGLAKAPDALNALFSHAGDGLSAAVRSLVDSETRTGDGAITARQKSLRDTLDRLDVDQARMQARLDSFRENLVRQFSAMEAAISKTKSVGNFLASQEKATTSSSGNG